MTSTATTRGRAPEPTGAAVGLDEFAERAIRANAPDLLGYLVRRIEPQQAPDVLAEVLATAWQRRAKLPREETAARMWLFGVARRTLANARRTRLRDDVLTERLRLIVTTTPGPSYPGSDEGERNREVRDAVGHLPPRQRELVRLVHWDGFSLTDAAQIAGVRASTARTHYQRARETLAAQLG